ncbi:GNAT family N-acetyltransferase [Prolixibacter denitrificans]|uniref:Acetoin utilization deacetylase AcuC-like enzyme n=1 Tax=Prolixibacter denitrificans TaxID=1541063 RepID=A0A2P8CBI7_9BACT|nr:GNAT family N-acetyltransferase [Prolixibacter denitrificans]PSK82343.1 acetoin utilization deacetylase AcuC-like enzyme [Prolixibacter denitrificans]GET22912.1 hypothetical protein JCM18694_31580 [Prolixibacter denitrificans]
MFRIRKILNPYLPVNEHEIKQVQAIIQSQFPDIAKEKVATIPDQLINPLKYQYKTMLFIADDLDGRVKGCALMLYMPDLSFCYLDFLAVSPGRTSSGVGGALYERVREEADSLDINGLFMECLPDDSDNCPDEEIRKQNAKRLAFYERYGARPITGTRYETPVKPEDTCAPFLVFDGLGSHDEIGAQKLKLIVRAILERKYGDYCPEDYIRMVVGSIIDDPVQLRPFQYKKKLQNGVFRTTLSERKKIFWVINDRHSIHHVRERGYVESPVRVETIRKSLEPTGWFSKGTPSSYPEKIIRDVHDAGYMNYFRKVCKNLPAGKSVYPYVFPIRNGAHPPKDLTVRAGYYCIDTFTPLNQNAYLAARHGVNCTLTAADELLSGRSLAYVLTRPPGHHAEHNVFGGFCYFNNSAIAAHYLSELGRVAILDIDYHHGNGQQQIFYESSNVLTISIHGHPSFAYPYFSGFVNEKGKHQGEGFNYNFPLDEEISAEKYRQTLMKTLEIIRKFSPVYLIVALGFDTAKDDPTGTWKLTASDFEQNGILIGQLKVPTLFMQEGGYNNRRLGTNARQFFKGVQKGFFGQ